jgi:hypothetical protein
LLLVGSALLGFWGEQIPETISKRYEGILEILACIPLAGLSGGMTGLGAFMIQICSGALPAPQAALFLGAGTVVVCIAALWIFSEAETRTDRKRTG